MHKHFLRGFTAVELIMVIVVIALLAVIGVVSYGATKQKAHDTAIQQDLSKYADALNVYYGDNNSYPLNQANLLTITSVQFAKTNYKTSANAVLYCVDTAAANNGKAMAVIAKSSSGRAFYVKDESPVAQFSGNFPSGNNTTDCQAANSSITTVTSVWIHSTGTGWLSSVL